MNCLCGIAFCLTPPSSALRRLYCSRTTFVVLRGVAFVSHFLYLHCLTAPSSSLRGRSSVVVWLASLPLFHICFTFVHFTLVDHLSFALVASHSPSSLLRGFVCRFLRTRLVRSGFLGLVIYFHKLNFAHPSSSLRIWGLVS